MALNITANFDYRGKLPNFARDQFATLASMKSYREVDLAEGHIAYCVETEQLYQYKSSNSVDVLTGKWRLLHTEETVVVNVLGQSKTDVPSQWLLTTSLDGGYYMS